MNNNSGITINIIWSRHSLSCGNLSSAMKSYKMIQGEDKTKDPSLTLDGIKRTSDCCDEIKAAIKKRGLELDIIASSQLLRAMETGLTIFEDEIINDKWQLNVLPYISESGIGHPHNQPIDRNIQKNIIRNTQSYKQFDLTSEQPDLLWQFKEEICDTTSHYSKFLDWVIENIVLKDNLTIFIVSHGNFIADEVLRTTYILDNNETALVRYLVTNVNGRTKLIQKDYEWLYKCPIETEAQFIQRISCDVCSEL